VGRDRLGEALNDAWRRQRPGEAEQSRALAPTDAEIGESQRQQGGTVNLRHLRQTRTELHGSRTVEPNPDRMRRLPFPLAHESALFTRRAAPVHSRRRLAGKERPELPKGFARTRTPPAMNAVPHRLGHATGRDDEAR